MAERGRTLERFKGRIERLRSHHDRCERRLSLQAQEAMAAEPTQLRDIRVDSTSDSSESALYSCPACNPTRVTSSSSDEEDLKSREKTSSSQQLFIDDEDVKVPETKDELENPGAMTNIRRCDCLRKFEKRTARSAKLGEQVTTLCQLLHFMDIKISKLLSVMEHGTGALTGKNLNTITSVSAETSVMERQCSREGVEDGGSDLLPSFNRPDHNDEDGDSDMEAESPTSTVGVSQRRRKRGREVDDDQGYDPEDRSPDAGGQSPGKRLPLQKKNKKKTAVKEMDQSPGKSQAAVKENGPHKTPWNKKKRMSMAKQKEDCLSVSF